MPPEKLVIGMGAYGYDWVIGSTTSAEIGFNEVMAAAVANGPDAKVDWDADQGNPVLRYTHDNQQHEIWFLDGVTALNMAQAVHDGGFKGVGVWRLGAEDPAVWNVLQREAWPDDNFDPKATELLTAEKQVNPYSGGEFLRIRRPRTTDRAWCLSRPRRTVTTRKSSKSSRLTTLWKIPG